MDIHPTIHTEAGCKATLKEISALMDATPIWARPDQPPDPVKSIKFRMDQSSLSVKDLEPTDHW